MRVRKLLDARTRPRLHHGDARSLDRPVRWVYSSDLPDPAATCPAAGWSSPAGVAAQPRRQRALRCGLRRGGSGAIAAGEAVHPACPADVVEACRRHDLGLLSCPSTSLSALTEFVVARVTAWRGARWPPRSTAAPAVEAVAEGRSLDDWPAWSAPRPA